VTVARTKGLKKRSWVCQERIVFRQFWKAVSRVIERLSLQRAQVPPARPSLVSRLRRDTRGCVFAAPSAAGLGPRDVQIRLYTSDLEPMSSQCRRLLSGVISICISTQLPP